MQVLPQLLNHITSPSLYSLDFSSLFVYTCTRSCGVGTTGWSGAYCMEYVWAQVDTSVRVAPPEPTSEGGGSGDGDDSKVEPTEGDEEVEDEDDDA